MIKYIIQYRLRVASNTFKTKNVGLLSDGYTVQCIDFTSSTQTFKKACP